MTLIAELIGYAAAIVGTGLMLPQVIKTIRTKKVDDLSLFMVLIYFIDCALWLAYGIMISSGPMILCNSIAVVIGIIQLWLKVKYGRKTSASPKK